MQIVLKISEKISWKILKFLLKKQAFSFYRNLVMCFWYANQNGPMCLSLLMLMDLKLNSLLVLRYAKSRWTILCQSQFNNDGFQLYTVQKCKMSSLVGLFYAEVSLTMMVSNYIQYKNVKCQASLDYFMPKSV